MRRTSRWIRAANALERWLRPLAYLAGLPPEVADQAPPDLDAQLRELLEVVSREESRWRVEDRIQGLLGYKLKRPPRSRPDS